MSTISRRNLLGGGTAAAPAEASRTLIRNVDLLSMDPKIGEVRGIDVLVDEGRIASIGKSISADGAAVVDGTGMILMPGMVDGHRHVWEAPLVGEMVKTEPARYKTYIQYNNEKIGVAYNAEEAYFGNYLGGLMLIDSGVTSVLDQAHITQTIEKGDALARGLKDSGVGGVFCYQVSHRPSYGPGSTISAAQADREFFAPADPSHFNDARIVRDRHFADRDGLLRFGLGITNTTVSQHRTLESCIWEIEEGRKLDPLIMTQHGDQVAPLYKAGVLGPDLHISHGNPLTDEELRMMAETGVKLCAAVIGEYTSKLPQAHGRAHAAGVDVGIGQDVPLALPHDFFEFVRSAFWSLGRTREGQSYMAGYNSTDILAFATSLGAKAIGLGDEVGSVTVGKRADLVLLDTQRIGFATIGTLADRVVNFAAMQDIDSVWVAGRLRKSGKRMLNVDWPALKLRSRALQKRVFEVAEQINIVA